MQHIVSEIINNYRQNTHMCHVHTKINRKINKQIKLKDILKSEAGSDVVFSNKLLLLIQELNNNLLFL
jgi:hypothetical protein